MCITIELPDLASQTSFNAARWTEILADPELARLPYRIETDREKRTRYFDAGATEVGICNLDGSMSFFFAPNQQSVASTICPNFPTSIP